MKIESLLSDDHARSRTATGHQIRQKNTSRFEPRCQKHNIHSLGRETADKNDAANIAVTQKNEQKQTLEIPRKKIPRTKIPGQRFQVRAKITDFAGEIETVLWTKKTTTPQSEYCIN